MQLINLLIARIEALFGEERAQDAIEYLLVIGGVSVVIVAAVAAINGTGFVGTIINEVKNAVLNVI